VKPRSATLAATLALAACSPEQAPRETITREQFIRASVALRSVPDTAAQVDSLRARALRREKVSPAELRAWLRAHERDSKLVAETWREIARRTDAAAPKPPPLPSIAPVPVPASAPPPPPVVTPPPPPPTLVPGAPDITRPVGPPRPDSLARPDSAGG
jgi:hypothetical protein